MGLSTTSLVSSYLDKLHDNLLVVDELPGDGEWEHHGPLGLRDVAGHLA